MQLYPERCIYIPRARAQLIVPFFLVLGEIKTKFPGTYDFSSWPTSKAEFFQGDEPGKNVLRCRKRTTRQETTHACTLKKITYSTCLCLVISSTFSIIFGTQNLPQNIYTGKYRFEKQRKNEEAPKIEYFLAK